MNPKTGEGLQDTVWGRGPGRVHWTPWQRRRAGSLGRLRQPEFLGQRTREERAAQNQTADWYMCVRKLLWPGKNHSERLEETVLTQGWEECLFPEVSLENLKIQGAQAGKMEGSA